MRALVFCRGQRFGRLTVVRGAGHNNYGAQLLLCRCRCGIGGHTVVRSTDLRSGATKSCGCLQKEAASKSGLANRRHGHSLQSVRSGTYRSWDALTQRCTNPNNNQYKNYGGAGVKVSRHWQGERGFENFLKYMGPRPAGTSIGRFGDKGDYKPGNCKWMTKKEQVENLRKRRRAA